MHFQKRTPEQLRAEYEADRTAAAAEWFGGDEDMAEAVLEALPYSTIPGWVDLAAVLTELRSHGLLKETA